MREIISSTVTAGSEQMVMLALKRSANSCPTKKHPVPRGRRRWPLTTSISDGASMLNRVASRSQGRRRGNASPRSGITDFPLIDRCGGSQGRMEAQAKLATERIGLDKISVAGECPRQLRKIERQSLLRAVENRNPEPTTALRSAFRLAAQTCLWPDRSSAAVRPVEPAVRCRCKIRPSANW